ncbi:MAG: histidine triad nucleotide-binding protein [Gammaproteobacteria bacterium CG11_big_fil_rev_8_21_14_0_20_46_22]|nr:MAG: histidine triad nucleotide-binding protein [Gammaproteobacteria bacterium CG12_big_fil_rev_8_21_14_0_65_46_12]PIR10689.1 MAG: histidine triad nucleotide-binding protein [Gammaproteobacteria bacterium CG11_big_fil_rev_8_21_14_0_20_46_22]
MSDCLFCKIIEKTLPATLVHEDEHCLAFRDIHPQAPEHILIIPKKHIATLNDLEDIDQTLVGHLVLTAKNLAKQIGVDHNGYRLNWNCNRHGGQEVYHIHLHLLAGRQMTWPPG